MSQFKGLGGLCAALAIGSLSCSSASSASSPPLVRLAVPGQVTAGAPASVDVLVGDAAGAPIPGFAGTIHFASDDARAALPADYTFTKSDAGRHSFSFTAARAGATSLTATLPALASTGGVASFSVNAGPASRLAMKMQEGTVLRCPGLAPYPWVEPSIEILAEDVAGNRATTYRGTTRFSSSDPLALLPGDYPFSAGDAGRHVFKAQLKTAGKATVTAADAVVASLAASGEGHVGGWCPSGPNAASILALAGDPVDPATFYAGTFYAGFFKTTDAGATWTQQSQGLGTPMVTSIVIDPRVPSTLYAAGHVGLYKSMDAGGHWTRLHRADGVAILLDPSSPSTLYAATGAGVNGFGVLRSIDAGATWIPVNSGLPPVNTGMTALALDPLQTSVLYASFEDQTMYRTADGGTNWTPITGPFAGHMVASLAVDSRSQLYVGTYFGSWVSADRGLTWTAMKLGTSDLGQNIFIDPRAPSVVWVGGAGVTYVSRDGAATWSSFPVSGATAIAAGSAATTLLAGTSRQGVLKSVDGAATWADANAGMTGAIIRGVALAPGNPSTVYAGEQGGVVFVSTNGGLSWTPHDSRGEIYAMAVDPHAPTTVWVAGGNGAAKSTDGGATWSRLGPSGQPLGAVLVDPGVSSTVYVGTQRLGVFKSIDGGASWSNAGLSGQWIWSLAADAGHPGTVYAGTMTGSVFKTTDGGATWAKLGGLSATSAIILAVNPADSSLVVGSQSALSRSTDGGSTWVAATGLPPGFYANTLAVDTATPLILYFASSVGVFRSTDGGARWSAGGPGLPADVQILGLTAAGSAVYAGSYGGGVFKSVTTGD